MKAHDTHRALACALTLALTFGTAAVTAVAAQVVQPAPVTAVPAVPAPDVAAAADATCKPDPLQGRALYLRGTFNGWAAAEALRFTWACRRWELVTVLRGEHSFKLADEGWSADADWGSRDGRVLLPRGAEIKRRFAGSHRFTVTMNDNRPELRIDDCPVGEGGPPLGTTTLFLRGTPNNWAALDDYAFQFSCDAYYLNLKASGRHEFKIADASGSAAASIGEGGVGGGKFVRSFDGEHTLRLVWAGGRPQLSVGPKSFADPRVAAVTDPVALSLRFDSRALQHKRPFGAVTAGSTVDFSVSAAAGVDKLTLVIEQRRLEGNQEVLVYTERVRVAMQKQTDGSSVERWTAQHRFNDIAVHGYWFEASIDGRLFALQNNADAVFWTREKGSGGAGAVADAPVTASPATGAATGTVRRFRQTVYAADFKVPDWAADAVYYYVFPERFRNGDKRNDPQPGVTRYHAGTVELHQNWLDKPWLPGSGDGSDAHHNNDFFGGDLAGLIDKLDYIRELGANTIYMTPVFRASSNHKYDTADYKNIDPAFGSNADFERLTREAARRGIRVIPDTSLNHTGADSIYFDRYGTFKSLGAFEGGSIRSDSPYAGWYRFDPAQTEPNKQFKGWVDIADLPELDKASPSWRRYAIHDPDSITKLWLDRGASGWRMDVAPWVPDDFWREWRAALKAHQPDALTVAETWFDASKYLLGDMFDSTMNYIFRNAVQAYAAGGDAAVLVRQLELMREAYPPQAFHALMNLLSSHDQARALHVFGWHDDTRDAAVILLAKQRLKLAVLFQMVYPGAPSVYYGDEVGLTGGDDPFNRATYPWADEGGQPDLALLADFKQLIRLRNDHAVLRRGSLDAPLLADAHVLVLLRRLGDTWAVTATNNAEVARTVNVVLPAGAPLGVWRDALAPGGVDVTQQGLRLVVPALGGRVLISPP